MSSSLFSEQKNLLSVSANPYITFPLGSSSEIFNSGFGAEVTAAYFPGSLGNLGALFQSNFLMLPIKISESVWALSASAGPVYSLAIGNRFIINTHAIAGLYYWSPVDWDIERENIGGFLFGGGTGLSFQLSKSFSIGLDVSYKYYSQLYNGISSSIAVGWNRDLTREQLFEERGKGLELLNISISPIFPVLYKYYDTNPIGTALIRNYEKKTAKDIKIHFFVDRYMDNPMEITVPFNLVSGEERVIELFSLFTEDLMQITEGTKASSKISLSYTMGGKLQTKEYTPGIDFYNRNAMTWDDDRKISSFITAKDPEILEFAKNVSSWIQDIKNPSVDENLQKSMAIFEAIKAYGIHYEVDPTTPFTELSIQKTAIDFLQFPRQTLKYSNGDCDDLSSLYTSMLEAVGIETAVITIPGHIYSAFLLKSSPVEAEKMFSRPEDLIIIGDKAWVPVEITLFQESFEKAWQTGAKEWRENIIKNQAELYETRESWKIYQAVGFNEGSGISLPDREKIRISFENSITSLVQKEIYQQETKLQNKIGNSNENFKFKNKLAVLYSRYGLYDKALKIFTEIVKDNEYQPALINLGNIFFIRSEYDRALTYFQQVLDLNPDNQYALLGSSRCNHELEQYDLVNNTFQKLKTIAPDLAYRFSYLDLKKEEAIRAGDTSGIMKLVLWEDE